MKKEIFFALLALGWVLILLALLMGAVFSVASDDELYFRLQMDADILPAAGISEADLREVDARLANYLFTGMRADLAFDNRPIEVFGASQSPFNARELTHLRDCRGLLSITRGTVSAAFLLVGALLLAIGGRGGARSGKFALTLATILLFTPIVALGSWAAVDFPGAFEFFHRMFFTNDLWLLDPQTDLLICICPASMFASMGLRIALRAMGALLGVWLLNILFYKLHRRKKVQYEGADL